MSQSNTKPVTVKPSSVPQCLRHTHPCSALEEAQALGGVPEGCRGRNY